MKRRLTFSDWSDLEYLQRQLYRLDTKPIKKPKRFVYCRERRVKNKRSTKNAKDHI